MKKVLLVEDDLHITELVTIHLEDLDCKVTTEATGTGGITRALNEQFDLIILDIMLPGMDGIEVLRQLRAERNPTPVLMLTAKSEEIDKVLGLETGADDYMTKPFSVREFIARVKAIFRRSKLNDDAEDGGKSEVLEFDNLTIDLQKRKVNLDNKKIELTPKEYEMLLLMAQKPGRIFSRNDLLNQVWGYNYEGYEHTVNSHINRLRNKIEKDPNEPKFILTSWGVGYKFNDEI
jgi:DNA-binding response OmpR family regulator